MGVPSQNQDSDLISIHPKVERFSGLPRSELVHDGWGSRKYLLKGSSGPKVVGADGGKALGTNLAAGWCETWIAWCPCQEGQGKQSPGYRWTKASRWVHGGSQDVGNPLADRAA